jgi:uncharacterized protein (TIGR02058 family)
MRTFVVELGTGVDLHGRDATAAAIKAVKNVFNHVSLPGLRQVAGLTDLSQMEVEVRLGVPSGLTVDTQVVAAAFPHGRPRVKVEPGGLEAPGGGPNPEDSIVIVNAVIYVRVP